MLSRYKGRPPFIHGHEPFDHLPGRGYCGCILVFPGSCFLIDSNQFWIFESSLSFLFLALVMELSMTGLATVISAT